MVRVLAVETRGPPLMAVEPPDWVYDWLAVNVDDDPTVSAPAFVKGEFCVVNVRPLRNVSAPVEVIDVSPLREFWPLALRICEPAPSSVTAADRVLMALVVPGIWRVPATTYVPPVRVLLP